MSETSPTLPKLSNYKKKAPGPKSRFVKKRFTDQRSREAQDLTRTVGAVEEDLGEVIPGQRILLQSLTAQLAVVRAIFSWVDQQPSVVVDGKLLPVLAENFITYTGAVQRSVLALYDLARTRPHRTVDLESYIAGKASKNTKDVPPPGNGSGE